MSTPVVAAGAGALGFYLWLRQWQQCGYAGVARELPETHARTEAPPNTWSETLYLFKEAVRYMYQETFGRWHAVDLFFGLAYLSRRAADEYPAADIAAAGRPLATQHMAPVAAQALLLQLQHVRRYMLYCQGLRHHRPEQQRKHWQDLLGLREQDILAHNPTAGLLRPAYVIVKDATTRQVILCVRGTHSRQDMFTSLTGVVKPHHAMTPDGGVVLGYSHLGMLAAARWLMARTKPTLIQALQEHPGYQLRIVGHSMGGGSAAMLTMMLREKVPLLASAEAVAIACPACMTLQLAASCEPFVTTLVHGTDIVPTFSTGAIDALRREVTESSWFAEFQADVRQRLAANFSSSLRGLRLGAAGTAEWTQRTFIRTAATSFSSCYSRAPRPCYSQEPRKLGLAAAHPSSAGGNAATAAAGAAAPRRTPLAALHLLGSSRGAAAAPAGDASVDEHRYVADALGASESPSERSSLLTHSSAAMWLRGLGSSSRHKRPAAGAAGPDGPDGLLLQGAVGSAAGGGGGGDPRSHVSEAELVERALEACLSAADAGQYGPVPGSSSSGNAATAGYGAAAAAAAAAGGLISCSSRGASSAGGALAGGGSGSCSRATVAGSFAKVASRAALLGKRPAAPGKKDDDAAENFSNSAAGSSANECAAAAAAGGGVGLPVTAAADGAAGTLDGSDSADLGSDGNPDDAEVAASSAGKPLPLSLRRRGWAWDSVLGRGSRGWVTDEQQDGGSAGGSNAAGRSSVVRYLGATVGSTGRLVLHGTGQLLRSSTVMFQGCAAPPDAAAFATATAAAASGGGGAAAAGGTKDGQQQQLRLLVMQGRRHRQQQQQQGGSLAQAAAAAARAAAAPDDMMMMAPSSSSDLMRMERDAGIPYAAAAAAAACQSCSQDGSEAGSAAAEDQDGVEDDDGLDGGSESDPDLLDSERTLGLGFEGDQPAMRASISALMAAVSTGEADAAARAHRQEAAAAERLLREAAGGGSGPNLQQQWGARSETAAPAGLQQGPAAAAQAGGDAAAGRWRQQQQQQQKHSDGSGPDKAAERLARRQMYPAGRILHFLPASVVAAAHAADTGVNVTGGSGSSSSSGSEQAQGQAEQQRRLPRLTAASGTAGLGDNYVLLEVPDAEVYGRMRLNPAMVRDHFIPSYLKAVDNVIGQLMIQIGGAAADGTGEALCV